MGFLKKAFSLIKLTTTFSSKVLGQTGPAITSKNVISGPSSLSLSHTQTRLLSSRPSRTSTSFLSLSLSLSLSLTLSVSLCLTLKPPPAHFKLEVFQMLLLLLLCPREADLLNFRLVCRTLGVTVRDPFHCHFCPLFISLSLS